ncbi:hypothetical protein BZM27_51660, partial [Paraburkholderia steynii]
CASFHVSNSEKAAGRNARLPSGSMVKYGDPKTGDTWTGHGRAPAWIANAKDRTRFLIDDCNQTEGRSQSAR